MRSGPERRLAVYAGIGVLVFAVTSLLVRVSGLEVALSSGLLVMSAFVALPIGVILHAIACWRPTTELARCTAGLAVTGMLLFLWGHPWAWLTLAVLILAIPQTRPPIARGKALALGAVVLVCGFGVVANLNYLLLHYMPDQRWDPLLRRWDMALYSLWAGPLSNLNGFFPLIPNGFLLHLFDSAYLMLIPQVIFVAYLMSQEPDPHAFPNFLRRLFGYYLTAIAIYAMFPVNGPHLFFPEQQDLAQIPASSRGLLEGMAHDYRVARTHGVLSGFGYFIGLPSLHALGAMFLQYKMRRWPVLFRAFLPINLLLATATIVLGYHYLADIAASVVIFSVSMVWNAWAAGRVSRQPAAVSMAPEEPIIET